MVKFLTGEWAKEYCKALNNSEAYGQAGKGWVGDFLFIAEYEDGSITKLWIDLHDGQCRGTAVIKPDEEKDAAFIMSGPYANWKLVAEKKLDPIQGLMTGKFKLKGDMAMVMRYTKAAVEMVNSIMAVPDTEL
ncbi:MAG: SCP2 sterol-binding domain-containing protein [Candidatus Helarchaeota archaeon]